MKRTLRTASFAAAVALLAGSLVATDVAVAQQPQPGQPQPGQPQPGQPQPGQPQPGQPRPQPGQPQPGQPRPVQPGQPPMAQPLPGQPGQRTRPINRRPGPGAPGGVPGMPGMPPAPAAGHGAAGHGADAHGAEGHGGGHCAGHGPLDPPPHVNWYQGLFGVDNEKALNGSGIQKLLYRYKNELDECDPKNQEPPVLAALINLGVVLYLLIRFGKGPVMEGLVKRKKTLMADIESANELKTDAEKRLSTYKKQLARIEERGKELRAEYASQWEAEKKRILAEAEDKSSRLRKDAEFRVSQELKQAEADLLRDSVDGALSAAEALIRKRIQDSDQTRLADEYVAGVAAALAASTSAREGRSA